MTRGRKKDLSIPASRALTQQRDYRARKAQYVTELEHRCYRAEAENVHLRKELEFARAGAPAPQSAFSVETAQATAELMQHLSAASVSLARFQQLTRPDIRHLPPSPLPTPSAWVLRPASFPSPGSPSPFSAPTTSFYSHHHPHHPQADTCAREVGTPNANHDEGQSRSPSPSPSSGDECCGGIIDCRQLIEEDEQEGDANGGPAPLLNTSGVRSTSDGAPSFLLGGE